MGLNVGRDSIYGLLFADDQIIIAEDRDDINYMFRKSVEEYEAWGLSMTKRNIWSLEVHDVTFTLTEVPSSIQRNRNILELPLQQTEKTNKIYEIK